MGPVHGSCTVWLRVKGLGFRFRLDSVYTRNIASYPIGDAITAYMFMYPPDRVLRKGKSEGNLANSQPTSGGKCFYL